MKCCVGGAAGRYDWGWTEVMGDEDEEGMADVMGLEDILACRFCGPLI